jgi:hypothetical protein
MADTADKGLLLTRLTRVCCLVSLRPGFESRQGRFLHHVLYCCCTLWTQCWETCTHGHTQQGSPRRAGGSHPAPLACQ